MPKTIDIDEQSVLDVPLYTYLDAAKYLHIPIWLVLTLKGQQFRHPEEMFEFCWRIPNLNTRFLDDYGPSFRDGRPERITFQALAKLFVVSSIFHLTPSREGFSFGHRKDSIHLFEMLREMNRDNDSNFALYTDPDLLLRRFEQYTQRMTCSPPEQFRKLIAMHIERVELIEGVPSRLFPFSRDVAPGSPRLVIIDPEVRFGQPTVCGAPTEVLAERWHSGDTPTELADDYGVTLDEVEEALRYEALPDQSTSFYPYFGG